MADNSLQFLIPKYLSQKLHNYRIFWRYRPLEIALNLPKSLSIFRNRQFDGANLSLPHRSLGNPMLYRGHRRRKCSRVRRRNILRHIRSRVHRRADDLFSTPSTIRHRNQPPFAHRPDRHRQAATPHHSANRHRHRDDRRYRHRRERHHSIPNGQTSRDHRRRRFAHISPVSA